MGNIGLFGGSFDPLHFGHLNLAFELMEKRGMDEIWFIPTQISPHKLHTVPIEIHHRIEMLRLAVEGIPQFKVNDIESRLPAPSFTLRTIQTLMAQRKNSSTHFHLLLGQDSIPSFFHWYQPEEIVKLIPLLIGSRVGVWHFNDPHLNLSIKEAIQKGLTLTHLMDVSSTELRIRLEQRLYCGHLVPRSVLDYIYQHNLYLRAF